MKKKLDELNVGDLIWANRYKNKKEKDTIPKGHEIGPFLIIKKTAHRLFALPCTTSLKSGWQSFCPILEGDYLFSEKSLYKKTCILLCNNEVSINKKNYMNYICKINPHDMNLVNKNLYVYLKCHKKKHINPQKLDFYLSKGDIIKYKKSLFYIKSTNEDKYLGNLISKSSRAKGSFIVNNEKYKINYNCIFEITKKKKYELINTCNREAMDVIKLYEMTFNKDNTGNKLQDCITVYNNRIYFVYEVNKFIRAIRLYTIKPDFIQTATIVIDNNLYYSTMNDIKYPLNTRMSIALRLSNNQIKKVSSQLNKAVSNLEKKKHLICKNFIPQAIIMNVNTQTKYVVLARRDNIIIIANYKGFKLKVDLEFKSNMYEYCDSMKYLEFVNFRLHINGYLKI